MQNICYGKTKVFGENFPFGLPIRNCQIKRISEASIVFDTKNFLFFKWEEYLTFLKCNTTDLKQMWLPLPMLLHRIHFLEICALNKYTPNTNNMLKSRRTAELLQ